jgi:hypothetical protein
MINIKNKSAHTLKRTPVVACSNYHPAEFVPLRSQTLFNRMFYYEFQVQPEFRDVNKQLTPLIWGHYSKMRRDDN